MNEILPLAATTGSPKGAGVEPSDDALGFQALLEGAGPPGAHPPPPPETGERGEEAATEEPNAQSKKPDLDLEDSPSGETKPWSLFAGFVPGLFPSIPSSPVACRQESPFGKDGSPGDWGYSWEGVELSASPSTVQACSSKIPSAHAVRMGAPASDVPIGPEASSQTASPKAPVPHAHESGEGTGGVPAPRSVEAPRLGFASPSTGQEGKGGSVEVPRAEHLVSLESAAREATEGLGMKRSFGWVAVGAADSRELASGTPVSSTEKAKAIVSDKNGSPAAVARATVEPQAASDRVAEGRQIGNAEVEARVIVFESQAGVRAATSGSRSDLQAGDSHVSGHVSSAPPVADLDPPAGPIPNGRRPDAASDEGPSKSDGLRNELEPQDLRRSKDASENAYAPETPKRADASMEKPLVAGERALLDHVDRTRPRTADAEAAKPSSPGVESAAPARRLASMVAERIEALVAAKPRKGVTIHLEPRELGTITLIVKAAGSEVEAKLLASDDHVRAALSENRAALQGALEAKGYSLSQVTVGLSAGDSGRQGAHEQRYSPQQNGLTRQAQARTDEFSSLAEPSGGVVFSHRGFEIFT